MEISIFFSIIQTIIVLIIVIALANISLKFANKHLTKHNKIIKVVERISINNNSALSVVNICGTYYLMSFAGSDNKILKELDKDEVEAVIKEIEENQNLYSIYNMPNDFSFIKLKDRINNYFGMRK